MAALPGPRVLDHRPRERCARRAAAVLLVVSTSGLSSTLHPSCGDGRPTATVEQASVYYVDGQRGADDQPGTSPAQAWRTLGKANASLKPGDTVVLSGGAYPERIRPARSGEAGQRITYRAASGAQVILEGEDLLIDLRDRSSVTIDGMTFRRPGYAWGRIEGGQHNEIVGGVFVAAGRTEAYVGLELRRTAFNRIVGNEFRDWGDPGSVWGDAVRLTDGANNNLLEANRFVNAGHSLLGLEGSFNVVRRNRFENAWEKGIDLVWRVHPPWSPNEEFVARRNVIEDNQFLRCRMSADGRSGGVGIQMAAAETIFRGNVLAHNDRAGVLLNGWEDAPRAYGNRLYHNTFVGNGGLPTPISSGFALTQWGNRTVEVTANRFDNNVLYDHEAPYELFLDLSPKTLYGPEFLARYRIGGNCLGPRSVITIESLDGPQAVEHYEQRYANIVTGNRLGRIEFVNAAADDYRLIRGSACIDQAIPLTTTTSGGNGRVVPVADASYFSDGFGVVQGDIVTISADGSANVVEVDYGRNLLTLSREVQWQAGSPVFWREYTGARPDAGAFELGR